MDSETLLSLGPEELANALLLRRKVLKESLPGVIRNLEAEEEALAPRLERSEKSYQQANEKVARLKDVRDGSQSEAGSILNSVKSSRERLLETGGLINLDPRWKKEKLFEKLDEIEQKIQTSALDHKAERLMLDKRKKLIEENESWLMDRKESNPEMSDYIENRRKMSKLYKGADKAHRKMLEAVEKAQPIYEKRMALMLDLREVRSQLDRARELLSQSDKAIEHWQRRLEEGFDDLGRGFPDLLADSKIVSDGGASTFARKVTPKKRQKISNEGSEGE
jgi:uncharacterized coiled-coil DUF342 family protein